MTNSETPLLTKNLESKFITHPQPGFIFWQTGALGVVHIIPANAEPFGGFKRDTPFCGGITGALIAAFGLVVVAQAEVHPLNRTETSTQLPKADVVGLGVGGKTGVFAHPGLADEGVHTENFVIPTSSQLHRNVAGIATEALAGITVIPFQDGSRAKPPAVFFGFNRVAAAERNIAPPSTVWPLVTTTGRNR